MAISLLAPTLSSLVLNLWLKPMFIVFKGNAPYSHRASFLFTSVYKVVAREYFF